MCGFVGILGPKFAERSALLRRMLDTIAHRGPDGEGIYEDPHIALGHRRLAIFDTSNAAAQPMRHPDRGSVLAFNGAIYNFRELRPSLHDSPHSNGDTEVLLRGLVERGVALLDELNGMWAFALWDPRSRKLLLSRDRLGVKPLYWRRWRDHLAFASEPQALLALDDERPRLNPDVLATFIVDRTLDHSEHTFFADIFQLPPGSVIDIDADTIPGHLEPRRFWQPPHTPGNTASELAELLDDAVALRMRADVSSAYTLSGGLDSSAVLACASARSTQQLDAYTLRYPERSHDESGFARATAARLGNIQLHYVEPDDADIASELESLIRIQGEPFADGSMLAHRMIMRRVAADGHKVIVGGLGGDEALAGYVGPYLKARAADLLSAGHPRTALSIVGGSLTALVKSSVHLPPTHVRNRLRRALQSRQLKGWLRPGFIERVTDRYLDESGSDRFHSYLRGGLKQWALPGFTHYEDRNAMHHGLEARAPFLDYRLIEWGLSQNAETLIGDGLGKLPLRRAMQGRLPDSITWRRDKQGLPAPAARWLNDHPEIAEQGLTNSTALDPWLDMNAIWRRFQATRRQGATLTHSESDVMWRAVIAGHWARVFGVRT